MTGALSLKRSLGGPRGNLRITGSRNGRFPPGSAGYRRIWGATKLTVTYPSPDPERTARLRPVPQPGADPGRKAAPLQTVVPGATIALAPQPNAATAIGTASPPAAARRAPAPQSVRRIPPTASRMASLSRV